MIIIEGLPVFIQKAVIGPIFMIYGMLSPGLNDIFNGLLFPVGTFGDGLSEKCSIWSKYENCER
jgi:hypothetical protein